jgi:hypothetical protein
MAKHRWALSSIGVTTIMAILTLAIIQYNYRLGQWQPNSPLGEVVEGLGAAAVMVSFVLSVIALFKKEPPTLAIVAMLLSVLSVACYSR